MTYFPDSPPGLCGLLWVLRWIYICSFDYFGVLSKRMSHSAVLLETYFWAVSLHILYLHFNRLHKSFTRRKWICWLVLKVPPPSCDKLPLAWPNWLSALATVIAARSRMGHSNKRVSTYYGVGRMSREEPSWPLILMAAIPWHVPRQTTHFILPLILNSKCDIASIMATICKTGCFVSCFIIQTSIQFGPDPLIW